MGSGDMKNAPPVLHGNEWDWPSDGSSDAWPDYLRGIPVRRLLREAGSLDAAPVRCNDFNLRRKLVD